MRNTSAVILALFTVVACDPPEGVDQNDNEDQEGQSALANLEGEALDLSQGWGEAKACVVWQGAVECFREESDADAWIQYIDEEAGSTSLAAPSSAPSLACSRECLHLYAHNGFNGRHLHFCDRGFWQNLGTYNFNDQLSSYKTGVRGVHLARDHHGQGNWYPGDTSACTAISQMNNGWNDEVSSIWINK